MYIIWLLTVYAAMNPGTQEKVQILRVSGGYKNIRLIVCRVDEGTNCSGHERT